MSYKQCFGMFWDVILYYINILLLLLLFHEIIVDGCFSVHHVYDDVSCASCK